MSDGPAPERCPRGKWLHGDRGECEKPTFWRHPCPFKVEIRADLAKCRCCDACRRECALNV